MEIPNLPTDHLYKFQALGGLLLVITCLMIQLFGLNVIRNTMKDNEIEISTLEIETKYLIKQIEEYQNKVSKLDSSILRYEFLEETNDTIIVDSILRNILKDKQYREYLDFVFTHKNDIFTYLDRINENKALRVRITDLLKEQEIRIKKVDILVDFNRTNLNILKFGYIILTILEFLGLYLSLSGFKQWKKIQNILDKKLLDNNNKEVS